ncbi:MAG: SURF1 family protein [Pseudomonadota bacterium]
MAASRARRPLWLDATVLVVAAIVFVTMVGLGNWQMHRLSWKLDLIDTVTARLGEAAVPAPRRPDDIESLAYLRVEVEGEFIHDQSRKVKALTELGGGSWLMTPLKTATGHFWINRGFVPTGLTSPEWTEPEGPVRLEGLLRPSEPDGTLLEKNDPSAGRWYSRDVVALSEDTGVYYPAPYFIDADHYGAEADWPRGGLTIVRFRNPHLSYALTWYAMALLFFAAMAYIIWDRLRGVSLSR